MKGKYIRVQLTVLVQILHRYSGNWRTVCRFKGYGNMIQVFCGYKKGILLSSVRNAIATSYVLTPEAYIHKFTVNLDRQFVLTSKKGVIHSALQLIIIEKFSDFPETTSCANRASLMSLCTISDSCVNELPHL